MTTPRPPALEPIEFPTDARGFVLEPLRPDEFAAQRNAHLAVTLPGCVRGNHYHERGHEITAVVGPALVRVRVDGNDYDYTVEPGRAARFAFPAGMPHAIQNTGDAPQVSVSFNTEPHDRARPDVVRLVLIETEPTPP